MAGDATFTIVPQGPFSLEQSVLFGFGQRHSEQWTGAMRLAFCTDDLTGHAGVVLVQDDAGVHGDVWFGPGAAHDVDAVRTQVARVLSLDHDARPYAELLAADPILARLDRERPGMRPPLFHSPYEAAAWGVLSARFRQADAVRARLSREHGHEFAIDGEPLAGFPTPTQLLAVEHVDGLPPAKLERLHGVALAALDGRLDAPRLRELPYDEALADLQRIPGIGPFYANLVLLRSTGLADILPTMEPRLRELVGQLWELGSAPSDEQFVSLAEPWRPFRTWASVLVRAAGPALTPS
jgi:DNA-3-methyladenine glycosylase II